MALIRATMDDIWDLVRPGDLFAFGGATWDSRVIKLVGRAPVSHTALVMAILPDGPWVMEAVGNGVRRAPVALRAETYNGDVWYVPLSEAARARLNVHAMVEFLLAQEGKEFDHIQMLPAAIDVAESKRTPGGWMHTPEDLTALFCSELVTAGLKAGGVLPPEINPSETTPAELIRLGIWGPDYYQIKQITGRPRLLPHLGRVPVKWTGAAPAPTEPEGNRD
jgi:hypothetical protein